MKTARQVIEEVRQAFVSGGLEAMLRMFDENCVVREAPCLPFGGEWRGREGLAALTARQFELMDLAPTLLDIYEIDESRVILHSSMQMTSRATGIQETTEVLEMFTVRDGLVIEALPFYWDAAAVNRVAFGDKAADGEER